MEIFDDEWLVAATGALAALEKVDGASVTVDYIVSGAPSGKTTICVVVEDGQVTSMQIGKSKDPDLVISLKYEIALAILSGELTGDAGYMNGSLKIEGAYERWMLELRDIRIAAIDALAPVMANTST